jgi:nucleoside-diphosphate-sugar epimerase
LKDRVQGWNLWLGVQPPTPKVLYITIWDGYMTSHIFLAGASRGVGREIARYLSSQGWLTKALLRSDAARAELEAMGIVIVRGDAFQSAEVEQAMGDEEPLEAVISTLGSQPGDRQLIDFVGNQHLVDAAVKAKAKKFILVSSIGTGNSADAIPPREREIIGAILAEKEKAEDYLIASGLNYTIIRPGGLTSDPSLNHGILTENFTISGMVSRSDVAKLACQCLTSESSNGKTLSALDRKMIRGNPDFEEFVL